LNPKVVKGGHRSSSRHATKGTIPIPKAHELYGYEQPIPACTHCGTKLQLELQLVSSLLHVLKVDDYALPRDDITVNNFGGMDWGNIAVYICPNHDHHRSDSIEEQPYSDAYCILQDSIDPMDVPHYAAAAATAAVTNATSSTIHSTTTIMNVQVGAPVIPETSQFNLDDDDDGIVLECDDDYDEDDDDSVW
jgi:Programmed cell death protein 2, C-terminal putative domain